VVRAIYADTSVVVAYYAPETHSAESERVLISATQRMISPLVITEVGSALRRKLLDKALAKADAQAAWQDFKQDLASGMFHIASVERRHYDHAAALIWQTSARLRTLDAIHLALADLAGLTVATSDEVMIHAGKDLGIAMRKVGR
jgi:predicted nucleic acid-binding protein